MHRPDIDEAIERAPMHVAALAKWLKRRELPDVPIGAMLTEELSRPAMVLVPVGVLELAGTVIDDLLPESREDCPHLEVDENGECPDCNVAGHLARELYARSRCEELTEERPELTDTDARAFGEAGVSRAQMEELTDDA